MTDVKDAVSLQRAILGQLFVREVPAIQGSADCFLIDEALLSSSSELYPILSKGGRLLALSLNRKQREMKRGYGHFDSKEGLLIPREASSAVQLVYSRGSDLSHRERALVEGAVWHEIQNHFRLSFGAQVLNRFTRIGESLVRLCLANKNRIRLNSTSFEAICQDPSTDPEWAAALFECLFASGVVRIAPNKAPSVLLESQDIDYEYLLSQLFGARTMIRGLDDLFGGGGPVLGKRCADLPETGQSGCEATISAEGRIILIEGEYGAGKTTLGISLATSVAAQGGVGWISAYEHSPDEITHYVEITGMTHYLRACHSCTDSSAVAKYLYRAGDEKPTKYSGAFVVNRTVRRSFEEILDDISDVVENLRIPHNRVLFVVDPIDVVTSPTSAKARAEVFEGFRDLKAQGVNLVMISYGRREDSSADPWLFEQLSDCIIRLTSSREKSYTQRFVEVVKNRLQREQRGLHPYSIVAGKGFEVHPSSAAVSARLQSRRINTGLVPCEFGYPPIDEALGSHAFYPGDVIAIEGDSGSFKSNLAILFLFGRDPHPSGRQEHKCLSLLAPLKEGRSIANKMIRSPFFSKGSRRKPHSVLTMDGLSEPYIQPGEVLQDIEDTFTNLAPSEYIDRVSIDGVVQWEQSCPFLSSDTSFVRTLTQLFRRYRKTVLFTCRRDCERGSIQSRILDEADTIFRIHSSANDDRECIDIEVVKTRGMRFVKERTTVDLSGITRTSEG